MYKQLFIGLGGQGARTIREIKKVMYDLELNAKAADSASSDSEEYKPFPCAYLSIDSSSNIWDEDWQYKGKNLALDEIEKCQLVVPPAGAVSSANIAPWIYSKDKTKQVEQMPICDQLIKSQPQGAAQKRRYGRVLFAANEAKIVRSIKNLHDRALAAGNDSIDACVINVFCSLGGGTGSGGVVDLVTLLRQMYPNGQQIVHGTTATKQFPLNLFLYVSDATGNHNVGFFFENQYAALRDLNALSSGLMRAHSISSAEEVTKTFKFGKRIQSIDAFQDPVDAIILSSNTNNLNRATPIEVQIKNVAKWAVSRSIVTTHGGDAMKIATGEDMKGQYPGEPHASFPPAMIERKYRFCSLGEATWQTPVNELRVMTVNSILANSFRQMLYANKSDNEGYKSEMRPLDDKEKAKYTAHLVAQNFLLTDYVATGWRQWAESPANEEMQKIMTCSWDAAGKLALSDMEQLFKRYYESSVKLEKSNAAGDYLSLPGRMSAMRGLFANMLGREKSQASSISALLYDDIMVRLVEEWENGNIGLYQAASIVDFIMESARTCRESLLAVYNEKKDGSTEQAPFVGSMSDRNDPRMGQWLKLTSVSFKIKGQEFLKAHKEDLINRYTIATQCAHIEKAREQLDLFVKELNTFSNNLKTTIKAMEDYEVECRNECDSLPLRNFILKDSEKPRKDQRLLYAYNTADSKVKDLVNAIDTDINDPVINIETNAKAIRAIVRDSIQGGTTLAHIFRTTRVIDASTRERTIRTAYGLANAMLQKYDKDKGSKMMGGIQEYITNMSGDDFNSYMKELLHAATFSYQKDANAEASGYGLNNAMRKAWIVTFPSGIDLSNQKISLGDGENKKKNLKQQVLNILGAEASDEDVNIVLDNKDNTKISVWQTEYGVPARHAAVVGKLRTYYEKKMKDGALKDTYWINIDDTVTEMAADLAYPDEEARKLMCSAALWIAENSSCFTVEGSPACVYKVGSTSDDDAIYEATDMTDRGVLEFTTKLKEHLYSQCKANPDLLKDLIQKYESALQTEDKAARKQMRLMVDSFIKPTAFSIALSADMPQFFPVQMA